MNTLKNRLLIDDLKVKEKLYLFLNSGDVLTIPYSYTKKIESAKEGDLKEYRLIGGGIGVHFPKLDEDISLEGVLNYKLKTELLAS